MTDTPENFYVVAYYSREGEVERTSRFKNEEKANKAVRASQLGGIRAEIIGSCLTTQEVRVLQGKYKPQLEAQYKIKSRQEKDEYGTYTILSTRVRFIENK